MISNEVRNDLEVKEALVRLLEDPTAFPEGGFRSYEYPLDVDIDGGSGVIEVPLKNLSRDATIKRACDLLSLPVSIKAAMKGMHCFSKKSSILNITLDGTLAYHLAWRGSIGSRKWALETQPPSDWVGLAQAREYQ